MKRILLIVSLTLFLSQIFYAQNTVKKWYLGVGTFAVDHTSVRGFGDGYFDFKDWSATPFGKLIIGRTLNKSFALDLQASVGEIDNKRLNLNDEFLTLITLGAKYRFANGYILKERSSFDPYLRVGAGYHSFDYDGLIFNGIVDSNNDALYGGEEVNRDNFVVSGGIGFNYWITENFGINIESQYNHMPKVGQDYIDFFQHSAALAFRFGPNDRDKDGILDMDDECPDTFGLSEFKGCPDTDGDGTEDRKDECVEVPGPKENFGCPLLDADGDGWLDIDEECDMEACPDGFENDQYRCYKGCRLIKLKPVDKPVETIVVTFGDVLFDFDKATLKTTAASTIDEAIKIINENPNRSFNIVGHTDSYGDENYNLQLGERRARSVFNALVKKGIDANRFAVTTKGEGEPKCDNDTSEGRQCNRRVEIRTTDGEPIIIEIQYDNESKN